MKSDRVRDHSVRALALLAGVVAAQILLGLMGAASWLLTQVFDTSRPVPAAPLEQPTIGPATLESGLPLAVARAQTWNSDAQLVLANGHVDWSGDISATAPVDVPGGGWLTYVFAVPDPEDPEAVLPTYTVKMERQRAVIVDEQVLRPGVRMPSDLPQVGTYPISSSRALLLAEEQGGTEYRRACPLERRLSRISLDTTNPAAHRWTVTYRDDRFPDLNAMLVRIDATTGEMDGPEMHVPLDAGVCGETAASGVVRSRS